MKKAYWMIAFCFLLLLNGCDKVEEKEDTGFKIYYIDHEATRLEGRNYTPQGSTQDEIIKDLLVALREEPTDGEIELAKPENVNIIGYNIGEAGQLQLSFDDNYNTVTGVEEVLMRAALVKTFTQIDSIDEVEFFINGLPLSIGDAIVGRMQASDFIDTIGDTSSYSQTAMISIYFSNEEGTALIESQRQFEYDGNVTLEQVIVEQLIDGPTEEEVGLKSTIPEGTVLNKISKMDGICSVDFSSGFLETIEGVNTEVTIFSIVNTLVEQQSVDKVQITIDGETVENYKSMNLNQLFERNLNIIEGEK